jgi:hypothetical protein
VYVIGHDDGGVKMDGYAVIVKAMLQRNRAGSVREF